MNTYSRIHMHRPCTCLCLKLNSRSTNEILPLPFHSETVCSRSLFRLILASSAGSLCNYQQQNWILLIIVICHINIIFDLIHIYLILSSSGTHFSLTGGGGGCSILHNIYDFLTKASLDVDIFVCCLTTLRKKKKKSDKHSLH